MGFSLKKAFTPPRSPANIVKAVLPGSALIPGLANRIGGMFGGGPQPPQYGVPGDPSRPVYDVGALGSQFKQALGRDARPDELEFFKQAVERGEISPYEVGQFLSSTPEAQQTRLTKQGAEYSNLLNAGDTDYFNRAQEQLTSNFAQQGRRPGGSSGYAAAYANAARDLQLQKQKSLANFYAGGFQNIDQNALRQGAQAQSRQYQMGDETRQRAYDLQDFYRQANLDRESLNYKNQMNRRQGLMGGIGGIAGGIGGGLLGGPMGAYAGSQIGSSLGRYY